MNCPEAQLCLQQRLDGADEPRPADLDQHLAECVGCREMHAAAELLDKGLATLSRPQVDAALSERFVAAVLEDRRARLGQVRRRLSITVGLAASILLMMLASWMIPRPNKGPTVVKEPIANKLLTPGDTPPDQPAAPHLGRRADDARLAMTTLTERVVDQTKEQGKVLMAMASSLDLPAIARFPGLSELDDPLDPAAKSLRQTTQSVADGIQPITSSARRAISFFVKEMPMFEIPQSN